MWVATKWEFFFFGGGGGWGGHVWATLRLRLRLGIVSGVGLLKVIFLGGEGACLIHTF